MASDRTRRNAIPVIYVSGSYYSVGYDIGRTFRSLIQDFLPQYCVLNDDLLPKYNTLEGKQIYDTTLKIVEKIYPEYIDEIKGTADGAQVPFHKLFLLHLDSMLSNNVQEGSEPSVGMGCTSVLCNQPGQVLIGHNEDALPGALNYCYVVQAHIERSDGNDEKFAALCYAGHLPGFCPGINYHGLVYSVNIIVPASNPVGKMPRHFVARALLSARSMDDVTDIMRSCGGIGIGDGMSINLGFRSDLEAPLLYNIEVGPNANDTSESLMDILTIKPGQTELHCNRYLRLEIEEKDFCCRSSYSRESAFSRHELPTDRNSVLNVLGDTSEKTVPIFRDGRNPDKAVTCVVSVLDLHEGTWSMFVNNPTTSPDPVCVLPMSFL